MGCIRDTFFFLECTCKNQSFIWVNSTYNVSIYFYAAKRLWIYTNCPGWILLGMWKFIGPLTLYLVYRVLNFCIFPSDMQKSKASCTHSTFGNPNNPCPPPPSSWHKNGPALPPLFRRKQWLVILNPINFQATYFVLDLMNPGHINIL